MNEAWDDQTSIDDIEHMGRGLFRLASRPLQLDPARLPFRQPDGCVKRDQLRLPIDRRSHESVLDIPHSKIVLRGFDRRILVSLGTLRVDVKSYNLGRRQWMRSSSTCS